MGLVRLDASLTRQGECMWICRLAGTGVGGSHP